MIDFKQIKPLNENDEIIIVEDDGFSVDDLKPIPACYVYIHDEPNRPASCAVSALRIRTNGEVHNVSSRCLPLRDWEPVAKCYARALKYAEMVRMLEE